MLLTEALACLGRSPVKSRTRPQVCASLGYKGPRAGENVVPRGAMDRRLLQAATCTSIALSATSALIAYELWRRLNVYRQNGCSFLHPPPLDTLALERCCGGVAREGRTLRVRA
jgi:hypothetical protein